jgi:hypothetical protein
MKLLVGITVYIERKPCWAVKGTILCLSDGVICVKLFPPKSSVEKIK